MVLGITMGGDGYGAAVAGGKRHLHNFHPIRPASHPESQTAYPAVEDSTGRPVNNGDSFGDSPSHKSLAPLGLWMNRLA